MSEHNRPIKLYERPIITGQIKLTASKACECADAKEIDLGVRTHGDGYSGPKQCSHKVGSKERPILFESEKHNMVMQGNLTGLDLVIQWLIGNMVDGGTADAFQAGIAYGEIGTGTTAPALTDLALTTPVARTVPSLQQDYLMQSAIIQFYWPDASLANDTFAEFGTFCGGSITLGSGNIFNHGLFATTYTKSTGQDITVQITFAVSQ